MASNLWVLHVNGSSGITPSSGATCLGAQSRCSKSCKSVIAPSSRLQHHQPAPSKKLTWSKTGRNWHTPASLNGVVVKSTTGSHSDLPSDSSAQASTCMHSTSNEDDESRNSLLPATVAVVMVGSFLGLARAARAEDKEWHPRRHYSRMGETFTPYWMDPIIQEQIQIEMERAAYEDQKKLQDEERKARLKAEREAKRQEKLRKLEEKRQQEEQEKMRQQVVTSIVTFPQRAFNTVMDYMGLMNLAVLLVVLAVFLKFVFGWIAKLGGPGWKPKGRFVYDRSLGGKKVWVPYADDVPASAAPTPKLTPLKDDDFDLLTKIAASARGSAASADSKPAESSGRGVPTWFKPPEAGAVAEEVRVLRQSEANAFLKSLEQSKVAGKDYSLATLVKLRELCQATGVSVKPSTPGGRDAMYRAGAEAAVALAMDPDSAPRLGNSNPLDFVTGLAVDLNQEYSRAASMVKAAAASTLRARLLEVVVALKKSDDMSCIMELVRIASLLNNLPVLQRGEAEVDLIASTIRTRATVDELTRLLSIYWQIMPDTADLLAEALGFDPKLVIPTLQKQMEADQKATGSS